MVKEKIKRRCKTILRAIGFMLGYFVFLLFGGYMFLLIEKENDLKLKEKKRQNFLQVLAKYNISVNDSIIKDVVVAAIQAGDVNGLILTDYTKPARTEWNLGSSVFFTGTVVTTIGYGNIHPRTKWGKGFCMLIATFGIPFTGFVLAKLGYGLSNLIKTADTFIENRIRQCFPKASKKDNMKSHVRTVQLVFVVMMFILIFLLLPAAAMTKTELEWSFFDSFYYCFISLSTIGLGDLTPGASEKELNFANGFKWKYLQASLQQAFIMLYLITGLAALSIILALVSSLMKAAAEKTLKGGTDLMAGGKALMGGKARRFASSIRNKASVAMNGSKIYDSSSSVVDVDKCVTETGLKNKQASSKDVNILTCNDNTQLSSDDESDTDRNEAEVDGNPLEVIIENANAVRYYTVDTRQASPSHPEESKISNEDPSSPTKTSDTSSMLHGSSERNIKNASMTSLKSQKSIEKHNSELPINFETQLRNLPSADI